MSQRFFVEQPVTGASATLLDDESRHLTRVMRAAVGDEVIVFDGSGAEFLARVAAMEKSTVELEIVERRAIDRELPRKLTLAVALPKGDRQKWLVEKATELGVTRLTPLTTQRGVAQPVESALARLRRSVIEASKQCGRNRLMEIADPVSTATLFAAAVDPRSDVADQWTSVLRVVADPAGMPLGGIDTAAAHVIAAVGPEGGFAPAELAAAVDHGWQLVSLGKSILRVETAAIAIAAWCASV